MTLKRSSDFFRSETWAPALVTQLYDILQTILQSSVVEVQSYSQAQMTL